MISVKYVQIDMFKNTTNTYRFFSIGPSIFIAMVVQ